MALRRLTMRLLHTQLAAFLCGPTIQRSSHSKWSSRCTGRNHGLVWKSLCHGLFSGIGTQHDYATIAYSKSGMPLWTNRYGGSGFDTDNATAIVADAGGNAYVTASL